MQQHVGRTDLSAYCYYLKLYGFPANAHDRANKPVRPTVLSLSIFKFFNHFIPSFALPNILNNNNLIHLRAIADGFIYTPEKLPHCLKETLWLIL